MSAETPFVIWFRERSGSSHLTNILDNHPEISCRGEVYYHSAPCKESDERLDEAIEYAGRKYLRMLNFCSDYRAVINSPNCKQSVRHFHYIYSMNAKACGFKFKFPIQFGLFPEVVSEIQKLPNLHVIALTRRNCLKQVISRQNMLRIQAQTQGACNLDSKNDNAVDLEPKLTIDVPAIVSLTEYYLRKHSEFVAGIDGFFEPGSSQQVLRIDYEDLLSNEAQTTQKVFEFLGVDKNAKIVSNLRKATPDNLADAIENYDELVEAVRGTDLEWMVD